MKQGMLFRYTNEDKVEAIKEVVNADEITADQKVMIANWILNPVPIRQEDLEWAMKKLEELPPKKGE